MPIAALRPSKSSEGGPPPDIIAHAFGGWDTKSLLQNEPKKKTKKIRRIIYNISKIEEQAQREREELIRIQEEDYKAQAAAAQIRLEEKRQILEFKLKQKISELEARAEDLRQQKIKAMIQLDDERIFMMLGEIDD